MNLCYWSHAMSCYVMVWILFMMLFNSDVIRFEWFCGSSVVILFWYFAGKCFPGWREFDNKCYWYFGGVVKYAEAENLCKVILIYNCLRIIGWKQFHHSSLCLKFIIKSVIT